MLALLFAAVASAQPAPAGGRFVDRPEEELLLLAIRLDGEVLSDAVPAYPARGGGVLLPFGELCRLLGLAIEVNTAAGSADGFFLEERRTLHVDGFAGRVIVEGRPARLDPDQVEVHADDLYVHGELIASWLPLELRIDLFGALVTVVPREQLPRQLARLRRQKQEQLSANLASADPAYPRFDTGASWWSGPAIDQTLRLTFLRSAGEAPATTTFDFATYATAELAQLDASAYLAGSQSSLGDYRLRLGRRDPDRRLFGPLRASEAAVGDVFFPGMEMVSHPRSGPGLLLTNAPLQQPLEYDRHTFRGELPPGWEVELYRNDTLLAFQEPRSDGRYEFLDVPLLFGTNVFRLVLHGPQGQRRERVETFDVSQQLTPPGELRYRLAANAAPGLAQQAALSLDLGLNKNLSLNGGWSSLLERGGNLRHFGRLGARGFWGLFSAAADAAYELGGGVAAQGAVRSQLGGVGLTGEHVQLWSFDSERLRSPFGPMTSRSSLRLDGSLPLPLVSRIPLQLQARHERFVSGERLNVLSGRTSLFLRGFALSNELSWSFPERGSSLPEQALGVGLVSYSLPAFSVRGQLAYELSPLARLTSVTLSADGRLLPGYSFSAGIVRSALDTQYVASIGKTEGMVGLNVVASYSQRSGAVLGLTLSMTLVRLSSSHGWHLQAQPAAGSGAAIVRAFLDDNGDGKRDEGETLLPQIGFSVNRALISERTRADGTTLIPGLPANLPVDVALVTSTLEDPFWRPARPGVQLIPRPGKVVEIDFPVIATGEIAGTVYARREGKNRPQPGVQLELVAASGAVQATATSAFDGFYIFTEVPPGTYTVRPAREQMIRARLLPPLPRSAQLLPSGTVIDGLDFVLEGLGKEPSRPPRKAE